MGLDDPRYLARVGGYTANSLRAIDKLEAVPEDEQVRQTREAHRRWTEQQRRAWGQAHETITAALTQFALSVRVDRRTSSDIRAIERTARRVDERYSRPE